MKYKSELADDLIKKSGADLLLVMSELKKAHNLQTETYSNEPIVQQTPIVIIYRIFEDKIPEYVFYHQYIPNLGEEMFNQYFSEHLPAHTSYILAVLRPVI